MSNIEALEPRRLLAGIDLLVDSFNLDALAVQTPRNHTAAENAIEDDPSLPGKIVQWNAQQFTPVTIRASQGVVRFQFSSSRMKLWTGATAQSQSIQPQRDYPLESLPMVAAQRVVYVQTTTNNVAAGDIRLVGQLLVQNQVVASDAVRLTSLKVDLDADTNRDGTVSESADEASENFALTQPTGLGALVLPNLDKDNTDTIAPDNWTWGDWNQDGESEPANDVVDGNGDVDDLSELVLHRFGPRTLPTGLRVTLEARRPASEHTFFTSKRPDERLRVFLPTQVDGNSVRARAGDRAIIGPEAGPIAEFVSNPEEGYGLHDIALFAGSGQARFGVEGIEQGATVDLVLTVWLNKTRLFVDTVRFRVAPFVLNTHAQPIKTDGPTVAAIRMKSYLEEFLNDAFLADMTEAFGDKLVTQEGYDGWVQDGFEIGYAQVPGKSLAIGLELARARDRSGELSGLLRQTLLRPGFGVNVRILNNDGALDYGNKDMGGNIEALPNPGGMPFFFHGAGMYEEHRNFFLAQDVNPELEVDTSWLAVGHVDEVVSVVPDGRVAFADTELAYALLLLARQKNPGARMLVGMNGLGTRGITVANALYEQDGIDVDRPGGIDRDVQLDPTNPVYNGLYTLRRQVVDAMGLSVDEPESIPVAAATNRGTGSLDRAGAFSAWLSGVRNYRVRFDSPTTYKLLYRDGNSGPWKTSRTSGDITRDSVFIDAKAFLFRHWWNTVEGGYSAGDEFGFRVDPNAPVLEVPVALTALRYDGIIEAYAYTTNHINALVDGNSIVIGESFGPLIDWDGDGVRTDILRDYVSAVYGRAYRNIIWVDARSYHNGIGSVHCGTNAQREIPQVLWWQMDKA